MKNLRRAFYVVLGIFYGIVVVMAFFAGMGRISIEIVRLLLFILLLLFIASVLCSGGVEIVKYYVSSIKNIKSCGDPLFDELDDFKLHCGESKEHYKDMINAIDFFYKEGGKIDNVIGIDLKRLFIRLEYLEKGIAVNEHSITCITSLCLSISATIFLEAAIGNMENELLFMLTILLGLVIFLFGFLYPYSNLYKSGERQVQVYELQCLKKKIGIVEEANIIQDRDEDIMFSRRNILNSLNEIYMRAFKKKSGDIVEDIKTVEKLNMYVKNINECRKERFTIGKTKRDGILLFDKDNNLVNQEYQILYSILRKYKLIYEIGCVEIVRDNTEKPKE